jgi:uncharacterized protein YfaS (alpha-2-macroglobulin family)
MPQLHAALVGAARSIVACALFVAGLAAPPAHAAQPGARVLAFSPQGSVPSAQQVRATFSEPMLPLGRVTGPAPFELDCALAGDAHWVDDRTWVMDLRDQTLDGQACEFRVKPGLKSLAGNAVGEPLKFGFQLPVLTDDVQRKVRQTVPTWGSDWIAEDQVFLVNYSHAIGKTLPDLRCEAPGQREAPVLRLPVEVRDALKKSASWLAMEDDRTEAVRCPFALAPRSDVTLRLRRPGLKADETHFKVRALPAVTLDCTRVAPEGDCAAGFPVTLRFNAAMPEALLRAIRVEGAQGPAKGTVSAQPATVFYGPSSAVAFPAGEFRPAGEYRIHWPEQALADEGGRPLARASLPLRIKTLAPLPLAYFPVPAIAIRPLQADNRVPVFIQGAATPRGVRERFIGPGEKDAVRDDEILRWMGIPSGGGVSHYFWASWRADAGYPLLGSDAAELPLQQAPPGARNAEVRLQGAGLHLLELQGFAGQGGVGPFYDSVAVLLTRLAVHLKVADENSAVWVTRMDDGSPVAGVELKAYGCQGTLAWQGRSDGNGLAIIDRKGLALCSTHPNGGVTVVARHTWPDGVRDVSLANGFWDRLLDTASHGLRYAWGGAFTQMHTVLDRSLFKPGETVSMRHVIRKEDNAGLVLPGASELPTEARIVHAGSGKEWKVPLAWASPDLPGDGTSSFSLPADAPLGRYIVSLPLPDDASQYRPQRNTAVFAVEAFRLPAMLGGISAPAPKLLTATAPRLELALHYADGGAAQNWPVTLTAHVQAAGYHRPAALDAYPAGRRFEPRGGAAAANEPDNVLLLAQSLALDAQGRAQLALPELPARAQPYALHVEMNYQDPNGEAQTLSQDFDVQPSPLNVGVRTLGTVAVMRRLQVQSLLVDASGAPQAAQPVRIGARHWASYGVGADGIEDLGEVCHGLTDAQGLLTCEFVPPKAGAYQFAATASPSAGRAATGYGTVAYAGAPPSALPLFANADKPLYRVGETADIAVSSPFERARVWLTLERQGVLESRLIELGAKQSHISLPIRREWAGNVAVSLLALDASGSAQPAALAAGITPLVVSTDAHALRVSVMPGHQRYQPRDRATVRIHVAMPDGRPLPAARRLSFVAVDEALLSLKDNPSWQLLAGMLRPRLHGVYTTSALSLNAEADEEQMLWAAQNSLIERLWRAAERAGRAAKGLDEPAPVKAVAAAAAPPPGQALERVEVTGSRIGAPDAAGGAKPPPARTLLDSLLYWQADVPVDDRGNAVVSFPVKDALSRFRLVAVASAGTEDFGTGMAVLDVAKDVQITAGLPPQVRDGDHFTALVTVRNTSSAAMVLDVGARLAGQAALPAQTLRLAAGASRQLSWDVRVPAGAQAMNWTFTARERARAGAAQVRQDALAVQQQVEPAVPVTVQAATLAQVNGRFDVPAFGFDSAEASGARVAVQLLPTLAGNLGGVQAWLGVYPYRCLEQTVSRAIGMHDRKAWDQAMAELPRYLDADGLANYFPQVPPHPWMGSDTLTAYLLDIADASGWPIPPAERGRMLGALERYVEGSLQRPFWAPRDDELARKLAALATLARYKQLKPAQLDGIRIDPDEWTTTMLLDWLTILRRSGLQLQQGQATQAMAENALRARLTYQGRRMVLSTEARDYWWWLMSHGDVDAARLLLAVADLPDWQSDLPRLLTGLLGRQQANGAWATTNANAWGTLAVDAFARLMEPVPVAGQTRIALGRKQQAVSWSTPGAKAFEAGLEKASDALHVEHDGAGAPWASVEVRAAVPLKAPRFAGYAVSRSISPVQQKVPGQWHVGDTLRVSLTIRAQSDMSWVVVNDPVPAGASLLGAGLGRDSAVARGGEQRSGNAWPLYEARDFTSFKSFYRYVPRGEFSLEYTLRLNNPGRFALPPTRVEAMYAPEVFGEAPNAAFAIEP